MSNANYSVPVPKNETVLDYAPNHPRRALLEAEISRQKNHVQKVPLVINGKHIFTEETNIITAVTQEQLRRQKGKTTAERAVGTEKRRDSEAAESEKET